MIDPRWYRAWKGDRKVLPKSDRQGLELAQTAHAQLQAQIAYLFGIAEGDREALKEGAHKLSKGEPLYCASCQRNIWVDGHHSKCEIAEAYKAVLTLPPTPKH